MHQVFEIKAPPVHLAGRRFFMPDFQCIFRFSDPKIRAEFAGSAGELPTLFQCYSLGTPEQNQSL